ncbi:MAG: TusE/DsrC/DsvC family sulfur relay protein [Gammaproteobacteria bacterium]|nr:TusE/DsrC/DsvC family sulfur relay protein [Gammaproteobacteria bacterium]MDH3448790.1 TusE/DsrC/DsvC family sulfur relay protein [Gammaproteobacteria bacterium]
MTISVDGVVIPTTATGFLENIEDWSRDVASAIAAEEKLELGDRHWDLIDHLRDEYINNGGNQPNTRSLVKAMSKLWDDKSVSAKTLYDLFPGDPSKQGGRIAGLPESRRKGGY